MRFYFHLQSSSKLLRDPDGVEAADLDEALAAAQEVIQEMRDSGELPSKRSWQMLITSEDRVVLQTLPIE